MCSSGVTALIMVNFAIVKYTRSKTHLGVFGILPGQQVQNWLDISNLVRKHLHEDFVSSHLETQRIGISCRAGNAYK